MLFYFPDCFAVVVLFLIRNDGIYIYKNWPPTALEQYVFHKKSKKYFNMKDVLLQKMDGWLTEWVSEWLELELVEIVFGAFVFFGLSLMFKSTTKYYNLFLEFLVALFSFSTLVCKA